MSVSFIYNNCIITLTNLLILTTQHLLTDLTEFNSTINNYNFLLQITFFHFFFFSSSPPLRNPRFRKKKFIFSLEKRGRGDTDFFSPSDFFTLSSSLVPSPSFPFSLFSSIHLLVVVSWVYELRICRLPSSTCSLTKLKSRATCFIFVLNPESEVNCVTPSTHVYQHFALIWSSHLFYLSSTNTLLSYGIRDGLNCSVLHNGDELIDYDIHTSKGSLSQQIESNSSLFLLNSVHKDPP